MIDKTKQTSTITKQKKKKTSNDRQDKTNQYNNKTKEEEDNLQKSKDWEVWNSLQKMWLIQVLQESKQFLLDYWHPSCYYWSQSSDKSWKKYCSCDKQNISVATIFLNG